MQARVLVRSFINEGLYEPGEIVEVDKLDGRLEAIDPDPAPKRPSGGKKPTADFE